MRKLGIVVAILSFASIAHAQQQQAAMQAAQAQQTQQAAEEHREREQAQLPLRLSLEPTRIVSIGLWPGPDVPCKLPKRDRPYVCHRLLVGPAVILSQLYGELIVARGDAALAKGERSWWFHGGLPMPIGLAAGEVLYTVGDVTTPGEGDFVATVYR
jgi:hypothetical protein